MKIPPLDTEIQSAGLKDSYQLLKLKNIQDLDGRVAIMANIIHHDSYHVFGDACDECIQKAFIKIEHEEEIKQNQISHLNWIKDEVQFAIDSISGNQPTDESIERINPSHKPSIGRVELPNFIIESKRF